MSGIIASKLLPPSGGSNMIERKNLLRLLSDMDGKQVTVLTAPAGYGKTILMVQLAKKIARPLVWYQLDEYDNDPAVFLQYLITGIQQHLPRFGEEVRPFISRGDVTSYLRLIIVAFINGLTERAKNGLLLVLDDYHLLTEPVIHEFVRELIKHLPDQCQVLIASRSAPPLALSKLRIAGCTHTLGIEELRFDRQEICAYFALKDEGITEDGVAEIEERTGGWPAAMQLIGDYPLPLSESLNGEADLYDYLATEVFESLVESLQEFLLSTSVLEVLTPALCDAFLGRHDSFEILGQLERQQLFIIRLTGKQKTYRYHQLFKAFLQQRLGDRRHLLLRQAGEKTLEAGDLESALEYFLSSGCYDILAKIIKEAGKKAFYQGRWQTVARWLEFIPAGVVCNDPWLTLYKSKVEVFREQLDEAEHWLRRTDAMLAESDDAEGRLKSQLLQARILRYRGYYEESLKLLEQISLQPQAEEAIRVELIQEKTLCLFNGGRLAEAKAELVAALEEAKATEDKYRIAPMLETLGSICFYMGDYAKTMQLYQQSSELLPERILPGRLAQDIVSTIYRDWGEFDQALEFMRRNVEIREELGLAQSLPSAYIQMAYLHCQREEWSEAEEYCIKALDLNRKFNSEQIYVALNLIRLAECLALQGRWLEARIRVEEALLKAQPQSRLVIAMCQVIGAEVFAMTGSVQEGKDMLSTAIAEFEWMGFKKGLCHAWMLKCWFEFNVDQNSISRTSAEKALVLASGLNLMQLFLSRFEVYQSILRIGLENDVETRFIQHVLVRVGEKATRLLVELSTHANPAVRRRVITPLAEIGGIEAQKAIQTLAVDMDLEVSRLARMAALRLGLAVSGIQLDGPFSTSLEISILGPLRISWGGRELNLNWRTTKTRDLLVYLAHRSEPVSKEKILEDLWPEVDAENATVIFHTTLYNLRRIMKQIGCPEVIVYGGLRYQLKQGSFITDRQKFQELTSAALRSENSPDKMAYLLERAAELYRGDYLEEIDYSWVLPFQENLRNLCLDARMRLARHYLNLHDHARTIAHLQEVENYDPYMEEVSQLLMLAYARQGNRAAIRKQYEKLETVLKKELGLSPSPAIRELFNQLVG